jgi:hypothetical protein
MSGPTSAGSPAVICPRCGNDPTRAPIRYVQRLVTERAHRLVARADGRPEIGAASDGADGDELPALFACAAGPEGSACGHRWPVLETVDAELVWAEP